MNQLLTIIDDFLVNPDETREFALSLEYPGKDYDGNHYQGFSEELPDAFKDFMAHRLSLAIGKPCDVKAQYFVSGKKGSETTQWIHADGPISTWAAVLYLDDSGIGGTKLWKHTVSGSESQSELIASEYAKTRFPERDQLVESLREDGGNSMNWLENGFCAAKFNRLTFYKSDLFHSRMPKEGFGEDLETGRLVWVAFFNF